jgi:ElaB/YqjD/DUF883 family membrane-anchored ribosome-binding protein
MAPAVSNGQLFSMLTSIGQDLKGLNTSVSGVMARLEKLESQQTSQGQFSRDWLTRLEADVKDIDAELRKFKDQLAAEREARAKEEKAAAKEAGEEAGVNKISWKIVAAIGAVALLLASDLATHFFKAEPKAHDELPGLHESREGK